MQGFRGSGLRNLGLRGWGEPGVKSLGACWGLRSNSRVLGGCVLFGLIRGLGRLFVPVLSGKDFCV